MFPELKDEEATAAAVNLSDGREAVVVMVGGVGEQLVLEDCITMEDLAPCQLVEYRYNEVLGPHPATRPPRMAGDDALPTPPRREVKSGSSARSATCPSHAV